jgi:Tol biopolymer transport system component
MWRYDLNSEALTELTKLGDGSDEEPTANARDGRLLYVNIRPSQDAMHSFDHRLMLLDSLGGARVALLADEVWMRPKWSPNGERIAAAPRKEREFWTFMPDGTDKRRALRSGSGDLWPGNFDWHPDGQHLVFARGDGDLYAGRWDGRCLHRLTLGAGIESAFSMSPDGRYVAYHRTNGDHDHPETLVCVHPVLRLQD